ncbi:hypothetical protein DFQ27_002718 [Actinomortierella ambigua]|uniref:Uncharacterized protein n=1 Tax=Actinomortierella ambigua TaxID=1343610 RepID=A0A9P6QB92_9FUNG|nr:hypothetical protein DFQ27_002718 [Actinomortierella ambigua]
MKLALDSMLKLQPENDVGVLRVLVREFLTMRIHAEATYTMHKFAASFIVPDAMNAFPLVRRMEVFEHAKAKVKKTVNELRRRQWGGKWGVAGGNLNRLAHLGDDRLVIRPYQIYEDRLRTGPTCVALQQEQAWLFSFHQGVHHDDTELFNQWCFKARVIWRASKSLKRSRESDETGRGARDHITNKRHNVEAFMDTSDDDVEDPDAMTGIITFLQPQAQQQQLP